MSAIEGAFMWQKRLFWVLKGKCLPYDSITAPELHIERASTSMGPRCLLETGDNRMIFRVAKPMRDASAQNASAAFQRGSALALSGHDKNKPRAVGLRPRQKSAQS
jgi:hypothetical protein